MKLIVHGVVPHLKIIKIGEAKRCDYTTTKNVSESYYALIISAHVFPRNWY